MLKQYILILFFSLCALSTFAQNTVQDYVSRFSGIAVEQMQRTGIPASILLAQGILESSFGNNQLAIKANNHFGLPCDKNWDGEFFYRWEKKRQAQRPSCFRVYSYPEESFLEYANFMLKNEMLSSLTRLNSTDRDKWIKAVASQGLSSKTNAEQQLYLVIEQYHLADFDEMSGNVIKRPIFKRAIHDINGLKSIVVSTKDSPLSIASEFNIPLRRILSYNDMEKGDLFKNNQVVYLESKRRRSKEKRDFHTLSPNETLYDVSQMYGIRLKSLCELNKVNFNEKIAAGERISLIEPVAVPPRLEGEAPRPIYSPRKKDSIAIADNPIDLEKDKTSPLQEEDFEGFIKKQNKEDLPKEEKKAKKEILDPFNPDNLKEEDKEKLKDKVLIEPPHKPDFLNENEGDKKDKEKLKDKVLIEPPHKPDFLNENEGDKKDKEKPKEEVLIEPPHKPDFLNENEGDKKDKEKPKEEVLIEPPHKPDFLNENEGDKKDKEKPKEEVLIEPPHKPDFLNENEGDKKDKEKPKEEEVREPPYNPDFPQKKKEGAPVPIIDGLEVLPGPADKSKLKKEKRRPIQREGYHIVEKGETLYRISKKYNVSVDEIKKWNKLKTNTIEIWQELKIKER